jgi:molecular chaperone IbpA
MAVAGFSEAELDIQTEKQTLTIRGSKAEDDNGRDFLHRGIAARNFERRFQLADHVEVTGAHLTNGLLNIDLAREIPEAMKPKTIPISNRDTRLLDVSKSTDDEQRKQDAA